MIFALNQTSIEYLQLAIFFIIMILYCFISAFSSSYSDKKNISFASYSPLSLASILMVIFFFYSNLSTNVVTSLGFGSYKSTFLVQAINLVHIKEDTNFNILNTHDEDALLLKNVWVIAEFPNKIIFSPDETNSSIYSIPFGAVLGETIHSDNK